MKLKYFLRGLGVGIVFTSVIFLTAYLSNPSDKMTQEEIIQQAKELGMVEKEDHLKDLLSAEEDSKDSDSSEKDEKSDNNKTTEKITENNTAEKENTEKKTTEKKTTEKKTTEKKTTEKKTTEKKTTEKKTTEKQTTEKKTAEEQKKETVTDSATITIQSGATSYTVAKKIQDVGMIQDALEFDTYLVQNGYANRIRTGNYVIKKGMSFEEMAKVITKS